jgi:hypothetical protein
MSNQMQPISQDEAFVFNFPLWKNLSKDVRAMAIEFDQNSVKDLVATYYRIQGDRIALAAQARELKSDDSPYQLTQYLSDQLHHMESSLISPLKTFAQSYKVGKWALSQYGIGPVITAGLISHIDISKAHTAGSVWRYAGMDPTVIWERGQKRPWNADLKVLTWKIGQSFMKFSGRDECFYGKLYRSDKDRRVEMNENGAFAERAKSILSAKKFKDNATRRKLEQGYLSDAQIDAQARRFAAKIFLSHFHTVWYEDYHTQLQGTPVRAPRPYAIEHGGHSHIIEIPNYVQAVAGQTEGYIVNEE